MKSSPIEDEILKEHSRRQVVKIGSWIGNNRKRFGQLMKCYLQGDFVLAQRSAWIMSYCGERNPSLLAEWLPSILCKIQEKGNHIALKRNALRVLQFVTIPRKLLGSVITICFDEVERSDTPISVRVYAMNILVKAVNDEPEIVHEILAVIRQMQPDAGPGLNACIRRTIKQIEKVQER